MCGGKHGRSTGHDHQTGGRVLDNGWRYDAEVWFFDTFMVRGQIGQLRMRVLNLAGAGPGRSLLDVGCGTGTLAIRAAAVVGDTGRVAGIDPAGRQVSRAQAKAKRSPHPPDFRTGVIESLPFDEESFDSVISTLMMHHLPGDLKARGLAEAYRVLKARGRLVIADFDAPSDSASLADLVAETGFVSLDTERVGFRRQHRGWNGAVITSASKP